MIHTFPRETPNGVPDRFHGNPELIGELLVSLPRVPTAGVGYLLDGEPVTAGGPYPALAQTSSLHSHVGHVVAVRPEEQMGRAHTRRIIAPVTHEHPERDGTILQRPGKPMGAPAFARDRELTVALVDFASSPHPALA